MTQHQTADGCVGYHGPVFRQPYADYRKVGERGQIEVDRLVRQRRIAYGRAYALILLHEQVGHRKIFLRSISPVAGAYFKMHLFGGGFCQSVGQRLGQQVFEVVGKGSVFIEVFHFGVYAGGKNAGGVGDALFLRADKIAQTQAGRIVPGRVLLP